VGRNRRKFTPEFKAEAVALVEASGGNIAAVAKELGIHDSSLGNWVRQFREQAEGAPSVEERVEIRELKRELDRVKRERDILAKAVAFSRRLPARTGDGGVSVHRRGEGDPRMRLERGGDVSHVGGVAVGVL
jgi:transposase